MAVASTALAAAISRLRRVASIQPADAKNS